LDNTFQKHDVFIFKELRLTNQTNLCNKIHKLSYKIYMQFYINLHANLPILFTYSIIVFYFNFSLIKLINLCDEEELNLMVIMYEDLIDAIHHYLHIISQPSSMKSLEIL
jgi:hypothetical protein